jgi:hypothetical protein
MDLVPALEGGVPQGDVDGDGLSHAGVAPRTVGAADHAVNHSTYHRGQITTLLRQLGAQPVSTDLVLYYLSKAKKA